MVWEDGRREAPSYPIACLITSRKCLIFGHMMLVRVALRNPKHVCGLSVEFDWLNHLIPRQVAWDGRRSSSILVQYRTRDMMILHDGV